MSGAAGALSYTIPEALGIPTDVAGVMPWSIAAIVGVSGVGFVVGLVGLVCSVAGEGSGE